MVLTTTLASHAAAPRRHGSRHAAGHSPPAAGRLAAFAWDLEEIEREAASCGRHRFEDR